LLDIGFLISMYEVESDIQAASDFCLQNAKIYTMHAVPISSQLLND